MNKITLFSLLLAPTLIQAQEWGVGSGQRNFTFEEVFGGTETVVHNTKIGTDFSAGKTTNTPKVKAPAINPFSNIFTLPKEIRDKKQEKGITFGGIFNLPKEDGDTDVVYGKDDIRNISFETMFDQPEAIDTQVSTTTPQSFFSTPVGEHSDKQVVNTVKTPTTGTSVVKKVVKPKPTIVNHAVVFNSPFDPQSSEKIVRPRTNQIPKQGKWSVTVNPDDADKRYVVDYINGIKVSASVHHKNGKLKVQTYYNKNLPAKKTTYSDSGVKLEDFLYKNGELTKAVSFYDSGEVDSVYKINNNLKVASLSYYKTGERKQTYTYKNGYSVATTGYYKTGEKQEVASIVRGLYSKAMLFNKAGVMTNSQIYHKGEVTKNTFFKNGKQIDKIEEFVDGYLIKRHIYHSSVRLETRFFTNFVHDKTEFYYETGELGRIDVITDDKLTKITLLHKNGAVGRIIDHVDGKRSKSTSFDPSGLVSKIKTYRKGGLVKASYYKTKDLIFKTESFKDGLMTRSRLFYDNGKTQSQKDFFNDEHTKTTFYTDKGVRAKVENFKNGKASKVTLFGANGRVLSVKNYTNKTGV